MQRALAKAIINGIKSYLEIVAVLQGRVEGKYVRLDSSNEITEV